MVYIFKLKIIIDEDEGINSPKLIMVKNKNLPILSIHGVVDEFCVRQ